MRSPVAPRSVRGGKQKSGHAREVIDEESEFRLTFAPMRRAMKRKREEYDRRRREQRGFGEECTGQQTYGQHQLLE